MPTGPPRSRFSSSSAAAAAWSWAGAARIILPPTTSAASSSTAPATPSRARATSRRRWTTPGSSRLRAAAWSFPGQSPRPRRGLLTTAGSGNTLEFGSGAAVSNGTLTPNGGAVYINDGSLTDVTVNDGNVSLNNATLVRTSLGVGSGTVNGSVNYFQGSLTNQARPDPGERRQPLHPEGRRQPAHHHQQWHYHPQSGHRLYELPLCRQCPSHVQRSSGSGSLVLGGSGTDYLTVYHHREQVHQQRRPYHHGQGLHQRADGQLRGHQG